MPAAAPVAPPVESAPADAGTVPANLRLVDPPVASPSGTVFLRYELADGVPATGDMSQR